MTNSFDAPRIAVPQMALSAKKKGKARLPHLKEVIGVDFGTQSARLVGLARDKGGIGLTMIGTVYYPKQETGDPESFDSFAVAREISNFLESSEIKTRSVVACTPSRHAVIRILPFPEMPEDDLRNSIQYEVEQFATDESGEKLIDYSILREYQEDGKPKLEVLIVAIPRNTINPYLETLMNARLEVHGLNLAPFSTIKSLEYKSDLLYDGGNIVVFMGQYSSDVIILEDGNLKFIRNIKIGGSHIQQVFQEAMRMEEGQELDPAEIESLEVAPDNEIYVSQIIGEVAEDIERTVHFCKSQEQRSDIHIGKIILAGFGIWPKNLSELLSDKLRMPVLKANPFGYDHPVLTNVQPNEVCQSPSDYCAAFGLALEGLGE